MLGTSDLTAKRIQADASVIDGSLFGTILTAMKKFPRNVALQQWAATAVWALVKNNSRGKSSFLNTTTENGESALRILKNNLLQYGQDSEATARACIGCLLTLATNSVPSQKLIADLALPNLILKTLSRHPSISFKGEFDSLREWLRDNSFNQEERVSTPASRD
jgi:hypothetical protein